MRKANYKRYEIAKKQYELDQMKGEVHKMSVYRNMIPCNTKAEYIDRYLKGLITVEELLAQKNEHDIEVGNKKKVTENKVQQTELPFNHISEAEHDGSDFIQITKLKEKITEIETSEIGKKDKIPYYVRALSNCITDILVNYQL